ncbi:DNA-directed RNA polymerase subunit N [Candidatus Micrarchaeota archaeon]|nr:DNA-directed RNA polymerase subunit N [Candidatus Micrarchaeota archaeon]
MEFPVRCFTCGAVIGDLYEKYKAGLESKSAGELLDEMGIDRYCCRRMFLGHVEGMEAIKKYRRV